MTRSVTNSRTGQPHPNAENIQAANDARARKQEMIQANSEFQRRINYSQYNDTGNHTLRPKNVRQFVTGFFRLSASEKAEILALIEELSN